jgi:hypothetical protein
MFLCQMSMPIWCVRPDFPHLSGIAIILLPELAESQQSSEATTDSRESGMFTGSIPAGMVAGLRLSGFSPTVSGCLSTFLICSNSRVALNTGTVARETGRMIYITFYPLQVTGSMDKRLVSRVIHIVRDDIVPISISQPWKEKRTSSMKRDCDVLRQKGYQEASVGFQLNSRAR